MRGIGSASVQNGFVVNPLEELRKGNHLTKQSLRGEIGGRRETGIGHLMMRRISGRTGERYQV